MARGSNAKLEVAKKIEEAFGNDYVGESGGNYYVWADDGGSRVQIKLAMTCVKAENEIGGGSSAPAPAVVDGGLDFTKSTPVTPPVPVEVTKEEQENIENLMARLGL
jgi:hypothetical protein